MEESLLVFKQIRNYIRIFKLQSLNATVLLLVFVLSGAVSAESQICLGIVQTTSAWTKPNLSYVMSTDLASGAEHRAHISITVDNMEMPSLTLTMHAFHGRYPIPILNFTASTEMGEILASREYYKNGGRYWAVNTQRLTKIIVDYDVIFGTLRGDGLHLGYLGKNFGMSMAEWVFLVPCDLLPSSIKVGFRLPTRWKAYTPWKRDGDAFYPPSLEYFATSAFALGNFDAYSREIGRTNVSLAVYSEWPESTRKKLVETAFEIFDYQTTLFGKSVGEQYLGVFSPVADDGKTIWGGEYSQSQGFSVRLPLEESDNFIVAMQNFSHQIFHRWNAWEPYGMSMSSDEETWFCEGTAVYYESKTLIDLGIIKEHFILRNLYSEYLASYFNTSMDMPVAMAGKYHMAEQKTSAEFIIYCKGPLTCLLLDINILKATKGERDLSFLLKKTYELYGGMKGGYSNAKILTQLTKLADYNFADFFKRCVYGIERLPLDQYFTRTNLVKIDEVWKIGDDLDLCATVTDFDNKPIAGKMVTFYMDSTTIATATTDSQGLARISHIINSTGSIEVTAFYSGAKDYTRLQSSDSSTIAVRQMYSSLSLNLPSTVIPSQPVTIRVTVKDEVARPINKATVDFYALTGGEWRRIGSARTDVDGVGSVVIMFNTTGTFEVKASYAGDWKYCESAATSTLTVATPMVSALPNQIFLFASLVVVAIVIAFIGFLKALMKKPTGLHSK